MVSEFLRLEILHNPDPIKRAETLPLLDLAAGSVPSTPAVLRRAHVHVAAGYDLFDALHLAACEEASISFLLTVDDRLIRRASRAKSAVTEVLNPVDWLKRRSVWQRQP